MSAKARRLRRRKVRAQSAYQPGDEVGAVEVGMGGTHAIVVYKAGFHPSGRMMIWKRDREINIEGDWWDGLKHWTWEEFVRAEGIEPRRVKQGDKVPTKETEVIRFLEGQ